MTSRLPQLGCRFARVAACAVLWHANLACAQVDHLPADLLRATQLTRAQEQQVEEFVKAQFERLKSDDPTQVEDGRKSLESPFTEREAPSIGFRLKYGSQVSIELGPMLRANPIDTDATVNALLVVGDCGTDQTVELLGDVLSGKKGAMPTVVRAAAVTALHNVIREADAGRVRRDQGEQAVALVARALAKADNAAFATSCIFALGSTERELLHPKAAEQLAEALPQLAATLRNAPKVEDPVRWEQAMQLGLRLISMHFLQLAGASPDPGLPKASVEAGAQALGFVVTRFKDLGPEGLEGTDEATRLAGLTDQAETLMGLAGRSIPGLQGGLDGGLRAKLTDSIENDDEQAFLDAVERAGGWVQRATGKKASEFGL